MGIPADAYFAGHFDGEGCVRIRCRGKYCRVEVIITIAHRETLDRYVERFGGSVGKQPLGPGKPLWRWHIVGMRTVREFIETVLPHSIEKRTQLAVALDWLRKRQEFPRQPVPDWVHELGVEYARTLTMLKHDSAYKPASP